MEDQSLISTKHKKKDFPKNMTILKEQEDMLEKQGKLIDVALTLSSRNKEISEQAHKSFLNQHKQAALQRKKILLIRMQSSTLSN